jgi:hypothetical protein
VVGGGLAGVCAAVAAARLGATVALINNRPVLGGNSSSEVRVWVCGATAHGLQRFARETGIIGELLVENQYRNPEGNPHYWDQVVLDSVRAEKGIRLFLNTDVREVEADGPVESLRIRTVVGWTMGAERLTRCESPLFIDCTGDGLVGDLAGARYRIGREARAEYGEGWAPETADAELLGSTLLFYTKDTGRPERFIPPSITKDITKTRIPESRIISAGSNGCAYWWIEYGGHIDTVLNNEEIRDELWAVVFGIWDYIKNSGKFDADNLTLEWVGSVPGKREYRRLIGDYVLTQQDIMNQAHFYDAIGFGGWSIDLHPSEGVYAQEPPCEKMFTAGVYEIPFRCLYSANVANLLMAGRNISASHVAYGSTRVMATCAVLGEAAGTAAALCVLEGTSPRELMANRIEKLQQTLLRQDASVIGVRNCDEVDLARSGVVTASSALTQLGQERIGGTERYPIGERDIGIVFPVDPRLDWMELLVEAARDTRLDVELWEAERPQNYVPERVRGAMSVFVTAGQWRWVKVPLSLGEGAPCNAILVIRRNCDIALALSVDRPYGVLALVGPDGSDGKDRTDARPLVKEWDARPLRRRTFCFRALPDTSAYAPCKVIDGYQRPFGGPHLWCSAPNVSEHEEHLEIRWPSPVFVERVHIVFNDDVDEDLINLHEHRTPFPVVPELVRDYRVEMLRDGEWQRLIRVEENRQRHRVHELATGALVGAIRLVIEATHGATCAQVVAMRVY